MLSETWRKSTRGRSHEHDQAPAVVSCLYLSSLFSNCPELESCGSKKEGKSNILLSALSRSTSGKGPISKVYCFLLLLSTKGVTFSFMTTWGLHDPLKMGK